MIAPSESRPRLAVCVTCRAGREIDDDAPRPGRLLYEALSALCTGDDVPADLLPVECLSLCDNGCSAAISIQGKWSYLLGDLDAALAEDILTYARAYGASKTGLVLPSRRPASLATMVKGRMPPVDPPAP
jgi:predicted metal-binding protein